jgi:hypothetical protein
MKFAANQSRVGEAAGAHAIRRGALAALALLALAAATLLGFYLGAGSQDGQDAQKISGRVVNPSPDPRDLCILPDASAGANKRCGRWIVSNRTEPALGEKVTAWRIQKPGYRGFIWFATQ